MKRISRILSLLLVICIVLSLIPAVFAAESTPEPVASTKREGAQIPTYVTIPKDYDTNGSYPMVVMLYGHGGNHNEWGGYDTITDGLAAKGFFVVTLDFPGCGASTEDFALNTLTNMKNDVVDVINHVTKKYPAIDKTRVGGFGYSMGGRIILEMIVEEMYDFATIELVAPCEDAEDLKTMFSGVEQNKTPWADMKAEAEEKGYYNFTGGFWSNLHLSKEWFADYEKYPDGLVEAAAKKYTGNSLVIWATNDTTTTPKVSEDTAIALNSATVNTYADGHSYSFYGSDPYTKSTVNNASVGYFVNELTTEHEAVSGYVQSIAKYGNLELTIPGKELEDAGYAYGDILKITVGGKEFDVPYGTDYSDVDQGNAILRNSEGHLTLALNHSDFATKNGFATKKTLENKAYEWYYAEGVSLPLTVSIKMGEKGGYYDQWLMHQLKRTNNREDYAALTDEQFANFRNIATTGMGKNILYRSSSPVNPEIGRNTYSDKAAEAAGVKTFINLADDEATAKAYENYATSYYSKQNVVFLNLGVDFTAESFKDGLADGFRYMTAHEGPYLVHCTEGKDRAGFVSALLECFMGAKYNEVCTDYMTTYVNYYGVEVGSEKYTAILESNIVKTLKNAFGVDNLETADLKAEATAYLKEIGLTDAEIAKLAENLKPTSEFAFLVTSDLHGQIYATDYTVDAAESGNYKRGLTRVSSYIKEMRAAYGDNLYVADMGDTVQGAPLTYYYAFNKPEVEDPAVKAFRTIGYDMWVVGNHEFNYGLKILNRQLDYATSPSTETEKQLTVSMANYLDAKTNSDTSKDWATWKGYKPYVIKEFDGVKVAIIGFGNPNIPTWDIPANWEGIYFADIVETYKYYEKEMLEKADMIVVVAHSGVNSDVKSDFIEQLIKETDSISFAFSGHEHNSKDWTIKNAKNEDIHVLQPFTKARAIAQVKVSYNKATGKADITPEIVPMEGYKLDEELVKVLKPYEETVWSEYMLQKIGEASDDFTAQELGTKPSAFMDLINTVQLWGAYDNTGLNTPDNKDDDKPAQLSISAPLTSGDNANIIDKGNIYLGDMFKLYRFENWFYQVTMKGEEIHQWLEFAATKIKVVDGKPTVSSADLTYYDVIYGEGFSYVIDYTKPEGKRIVSMTYNGKEVTADQTFTVVVNNYRYNGGGHYIEWLNAHGCNFKNNDPDRIIYSTQFDMIQGEDKGQARNLLTDYIKNAKTISPKISSTWKLTYTPFVNPFTDVKESAWYYKYVMEMAEDGIVKGMTTTTFEPEGTLTRAQAVMLLYRIKGEPAVEGTSTFTDVDKNAWYAKAIAWAEKENVVNGMTKTTFEPEGEVTRAQFVTMLYRFAGKPENQAAATFTDVKDGWYMDAVSWAETNQIVNGMTKTTFEPEGSCTRAQAAKILSLFLALK